MPVKLYKRGKKYCVTDRPGGTTKGRCHVSRPKAMRQLRAINMNLRKAGKI